VLPAPQLKARARRHNRSLEGELRQILAEAALPSRADILAEVDAIASRLVGRWTEDTAALVREDRDR
jgi:plasmid stability protein